MKLFKTLFLLVVFLLSSLSVVHAAPCEQNSPRNQCVDSLDVCRSQFGGVSTMGDCSRGICCQVNPWFNPTSGSTTTTGTSGSTGGLQTNIDSDARSFFNIKTIDQFLPNVLQIGLTLGAVSALFYLIWGGIEYLTSGGNQERNKSAKAKISTAIAGLAILASVWAIWRLLVYFLGITPSVRGPLKLLIPAP